MIVNHDGTTLWRYRPTSGFGELNHPSLAIMLPNGNIAVNDDFRDRVVVIDPRTSKIVWIYGHTDHAGTRPATCTCRMAWTSFRSTRTDARNGHASITPSPSRPRARRRRSPPQE